MNQFLPHYPDTNVSPGEFLATIASKKEFQPESLVDSRLFAHQLFISRFVSPYTTYDELILFHEMGSGKTQSAITVAETLMSNPNSGIDKTVVVVRGRGLAHNFIGELTGPVTAGKYTAQRKAWKPYYEFWTMEVFGKALVKLRDVDLLRRYNKKLFIIDEAHHLKEGQTVYQQVHRLFHLVPHRKVLLLTGTPMKDDASEIANCVNLVAPPTRQLPYSSAFNEKFFHNHQLVHKQQLAKSLSGLVSFYKGRGPTVTKTFEGSICAPMEHIPTVRCELDPFQDRVCQEAHLLDLKESSVYIHSRQASLFVFPDGSYGKMGFNKYVKVSKVKTLTGRTSVRYVLEPQLIKAVTDNLGRYSAKFKKVLDVVLSPAAPKTFIYSEFVFGSGAVLLAQILKLYGYTQASGTETVPGKRFILATNHSVSTNLGRLIDKFNAPENQGGELIQIFIGSQIISEGYSLHNVTTEFILTPHWNFSETEQIIARCWRINSHTPAVRGLSVHLLVVSPTPSATDTPFGQYGIDLYMYKTSENKDYKIKQVERLLKELSVDCHNHIVPAAALDGSRDCDYTDCAIDCVGVPGRADQASYEVLYPPYEKLEAQLGEIFSKSHMVSLDDVILAMGDHGGSVIAFIVDLIFGNIPLSVGGKYVFLRTSGNMLYITEDSSTPLDTATPLEPALNTSLTSQELVQDMEKDWLMTCFTLLFESGALPKTILHKLPRDYQHFLLTACLYADKIGNGENDTVKNVLDYYKGFYKRGTKTYVWLFHEKFGTVQLVLTDSTALWEQADRDVYQELRDRLYSSPVGYYGLYNPRLNEFCLRKVSRVQETDLRRVAVGRRCEDWDQSSLVDIIQNKLKLKVNFTDHNRAALCGIIRRELFSRKLVMYNFDCGNQFKIRGRV